MTEGVGTESARIADLLEVTGNAFESGELEWGQGAARSWRGKDPNGNIQWAYCLIGGLSQRNHHNVSIWEVTGAVSRHLGLMDQTFIASWNDSADRTVDEVIDALKGTAKDIRNQLEPGDG